MPSVEYLTELKDQFCIWHRSNEQQTWLAKARERKYQLIADLRNGGKLAFKQIKTDAAPIVNSIVCEVQADVIKTKWPKQGHKVIQVKTGHQLDHRWPVTFQGQTRSIVSCEQDKIILDKPVALKGDDMKLYQKNIVVEPTEMHSHLFASWNKFFQRDVWNGEPVPEEQLPDSLKNVPWECKQQLEPITGHQLHRAIHKTKIISSRGSDGFSTNDLRKLPLHLFNILAIIFQLIECSGYWPAMWTIARTICLAKTTEDCSPMSIRPVTIMSKLYRLWGKIRGGQVSIWLARNLQAKIGGPCAGISADCIALLTAQLFESAVIDNKRMVGVVIDIIKCYNSIPREILLCLLAKLGVPPMILRAFRSMLNQLGRCFEVAGSCSTPQHTTTGIVEGCGFSVPCMLAIGVMFHHVLKSRAPNCDTVMYADNWAIYANTIEDLQTGLFALQDMMNQLQMKIAADKSWSWATKAKDRLLLRSVTCQNIPIPVKHEAKDLGVQQCYTRRRRVQHVKQRVQKANKKLKIIKKAKVPRGFKKTMVINSGLAAGLYGATVASPSQADIHTMRVEVSRAILRSGAGVNAYLACNSRDNNLDPEQRIIIQRFQQWRRYLSVFPERISEVHQHMLLLQTNPVIKNGPMYAFVKMVASLHGVIQEQATTISLAGYHFNWMNLSMKKIKHIIQHAWNVLFCGERIDRKFFNISAFDVHSNALSLRKRSHRHQALIDAHLTGKHYTNDFRSKYIPSCDKTCPLCQKQEDSRQHRIFKCTALNDIRKKYPAIKEIKTQWKEGNWFFGLCPKVFRPVKPFAKAMNRPIHASIPSDDGILHTVFTDGTAFFQQLHDFTIAAGAYVTLHDDQLKIMQTQRSVVPGLDQNSFTGEMWGVFLAMEDFFQLHIHCDCDALCDLIEHAIEVAEKGLVMKHQYQSIWQLLFQHISARPKGAIKVAKIKAHRAETTTMSEQERWMCFGNNSVDAQAKMAITSDHSRDFATLQKAAERQLRYRSQTEQLHAFIGEAAEFALTVDITAKKNARCLNKFDEGAIPLQMPTNGTRTTVVFPEKCLQTFPWGAVYLWRLQQWAATMVWPLPGRGSSDISFLELYIDFVLYTQTRVPVNTTTVKQRQARKVSWTLEDLHIRMDADGSPSLYSQAITWTRSLSWLLQYVPQLFPHAKMIPRAYSHALFGDSAWRKGIQPRPRLVSNNRAAAFLHGFFVRETGVSRSLQSPTGLPFKPWTGHPGKLDVPPELAAGDINFAKETFSSFAAEVN
eukprot:Skav232063  [mRNA]  locus=scaffold1641:153230:157003:- [translate_table: standard]